VKGSGIVTSTLLQNIMNEKPIDYFGNEIKEGDIVAYPTSQSSSATMNHGRVWAIRPYTTTKYNYKTKQHEEDVTAYKLGIKKLGWSGYGFGQVNDADGKKVTIDNIRRCINLSNIQVDKLAPQG